MIRVCPECRYEVPADSDFCYYCGRKVRIVEETMGEDTSCENNTCSRCGNVISPDDILCKGCGNVVIGGTGVKVIRPQLSKQGKLGILLAVIPGILGIFGIGHLFFKKWPRAMMFLAISFFMHYIWYTSDLSGIWVVMFFISGIFMYVLQTIEVFISALIFSKTSE